jgi:hypothetical protein
LHGSHQVSLRHSRPQDPGIMIPSRATLAPLPNDTRLERATRSALRGRCERAVRDLGIRVDEGIVTSSRTHTFMRTLLLRRAGAAAGGSRPDRTTIASWFDALGKKQTTRLMSRGRSFNHQGDYGFGDVTSTSTRACDRRRVEPPPGVRFTSTPGRSTCTSTREGRGVRADVGFTT